jgi:hypothetical protein
MPRARLAVYKVCWFKDLTGRWSDVDILAAFDDALRDGVGVAWVDPAAVCDKHRGRVVPRDAYEGHDGVLGGERRAGRGDGGSRDNNFSQ